MGEVKIYYFFFLVDMKYIKKNLFLDSPLPTPTCVGSFLK